MLSTPTDVPNTADREFGHPLKALPWIRNLPDTLWVAILLTGLMSFLTAIAFALIGRYPGSLDEFVSRFATSLVYAFAIGYSIHLLSHVFVPRIRIWLGNQPFVLRLIADVALWICGAFLGFFVATTILRHDFREAAYPFITVLGGTALLSIVTGIALRQRALSELTAEREKTERSEAQRTLALARLRLLQAQIEPHFLFNTLANVSSLIEIEPQQARRMLDQFTLLLRASLDQTRKATTTLQGELQVIDAYLSVLKVRMGERLSYRIDAPPELAAIEIPSMLLQPIVENAVKHGVEPRVKGGTVQVSVHRDAGRIALVVADDGVGFMPGSKDNIGLGAVRERLTMQFGAAASMNVERTPDGWTRISIHLPAPT